MIQIKKFESDQQTSDFYAIMGEHFASLEHKKEFGGWQLYNKLDSIWFLLYDNEILIGFCAFFKKKDYYYLDNFMILKDFRKKGYSKILMEECLKHFNNIKISVMTNNEIQMRLLEKFCFIRRSLKGRYIIYERS